MEGFFKNKISKITTLGTVLVSTIIGTANPETLKEKKDRARQELLQKGVTAEQRGAYVLGVNDLIYNAVVPRAYTQNSYKPTSMRAADEIVDKKPIAVTLAIGERIIEGLKKQRRIENTQREDAWRMYLGIPQKNKTFNISEYIPKNSKEKIYYYKFNDPGFLFRSMSGTTESLRIILNTFDMYKKDTYIAEDPVVLHHFQWSKGEDEKGKYISYYDKWDLNVPVEKNGFFGKPFEIYDRIYYDPDTFELIK